MTSPIMMDTIFPSCGLYLFFIFTFLLGHSHDFPYVCYGTEVLAGRTTVTVVVGAISPLFVFYEQQHGRYSASQRSIAFSLTTHTQAYTIASGTSL